MILISVILGIFSGIHFLIMLFLYFGWYVHRALQTFLFRRRFYRAVLWVSLLLITAIIANAVVMRLNGFNTGLIMVILIALIPAILGMLAGFEACGVLRRNFIQQVKMGRTCSFVISSFTKKEVYGYAIIDDVWFDAEADIDIKRIASLKEEQQITAVICKACPDNPLIIVRF